MNHRSTNLPSVGLTSPLPCQHFPTKPPCDHMTVPWLPGLAGTPSSWPHWLELLGRWEWRPRWRGPARRRSRGPYGRSFHRRSWPTRRLIGERRRRPCVPTAPRRAELLNLVTNKQFCRMKIIYYVPNWRTIAWSLLEHRCLHESTRIIAMFSTPKILFGISCTVTSTDVCVYYSACLYRSLLRYSYERPLRNQTGLTELPMLHLFYCTFLQFLPFT